MKVWDLIGRSVSGVSPFNSKVQPFKRYIALRKYTNVATVKPFSLPPQRRSASLCVDTHQLGMTVASRDEGMMEALQGGQPGAGGRQKHDGSERNIVFFDVETNVPGRMCRGYELLEFGAVVLDARGLAELDSYHTLIRPKDLSCIDRRTTDCNTITTATVADAPAFENVADDIYRLLHEHIWAGHNVLKFDILRVNEAFLKIGRQPPQPFGVVDTYPLLRKTFGKRAGNYKLATLANYCGFGKQEHRSIADVRMNINVLRSCATMLFLESNYPGIFMAQMEVTTASASMLEQSAGFSISSPQNRVLDNDNADQEGDSQFRLSDQTPDSSSVFRPSHVQSRSSLSFKTDPNSGFLDVTDSSQKPRLLWESEDTKFGALDNTEEGSSTFEVQNHTSSCIRDIREGEECDGAEYFSKIVNASNIKHIEEDRLTGYEQISEKIGVAEVMDAKSGKVETCLSLDEEGQARDESIPNRSVLDNLEKLGNGAEQELSEAILSLSLKEDLQSMVASGSTISKCDLSLSTVQLSNSASRTELEGVPFLLASHVSLPSIEVREEPSSFGCNKVLYYNGFPLHLLEFKVRVRFTVNLSYAFDEKGKPRFSVLMEPSESACHVIRKCEDVVKDISGCNSEVEWLPALKKESGCWVARMSIGTKWVEPFSKYTTEFFHATSNGLEKISLGHVDASTFRNVIPHGSIIDAGFGFYVFNVNNRTGIKLLAKHITMT